MNTHRDHELVALAMIRHNFPREGAITRTRLVL